MNEFIGRKVRVVKDTSEESPLADNGWKIGDVGIIQMVLTDHPEYNIIVQRSDDRHDTLGFSIEELELLNA